MYYNYFYNALYIKGYDFHNHWLIRCTSLFEKSKLTFNRQFFYLLKILPLAANLALSCTCTCKNLTSHDLCVFFILQVWACAVGIKELYSSGTFSVITFQNVGLYYGFRRDIMYMTSEYFYVAFNRLYEACWSWIHFLLYEKSVWTFSKTFL